MVFLHLADLHLGKRMNGYDLLEDQRDFLFRVALGECQKREAHTILICGDVYDSSDPSSMAMSLFDEFLTACAESKIRVLLISGNHDSEEKLSYASSFLSKHGIEVRTELEERPTPITVEDVDFYLIPFFNGVSLKQRLGHELTSFEEGFAEYLSRRVPGPSQSSVLLLHQAFRDFKGGAPEFSGSETSYVGLSKTLPASLLSPFTYCALGHIHKAYPPSSNSYYCGSPLKYHIDEATQKKELLFVSVQKGSFSLEHVPFHPLHEVVVEKGNFEELMAKRNEEDYVFALLTDPVLPPHASERLRQKAFPRLLSLRLETSSVGGKQDPIALEGALSNWKPAPLEESFASFYRSQCGEEMSPFQKGLVKQAEKEAEEAR